MKQFAVLLRGVNVGGKNKVAMATLREHLTHAGFKNVRTYIASGNILLASDQPADKVRAQIETILTKHFKLDSELIKALVLDQAQLGRVIANKPKGFGEQPSTYNSDAVFLIDIDAAQAMQAFSPREGVDVVWPGDGVVYSQRLSAQRTKSRLNRIVLSPLYKSMTIRSWNTVLQLRELLDKKESP